MLHLIFYESRRDTRTAPKAFLAAFDADKGACAAGYAVAARWQEFLRDILDFRDGYAGSPHTGSRRRMPIRR